MRLHFPQIGVIADMVAGAVLSHVRPTLRLARDRFHHPEGFENGARIPLASAQIVDFATTGFAINPARDLGPR